MQHLTLEQKKKAAIFSETLEHDILKKNLQFCIAQYAEPIFTEATLRQKNHIYQESHNHGMDTAPRWQETKVSRNLECKLTGNDVEAGEPIALQYDSQIKPELFKTSVTKINVRGQKIVQPIQSLLCFLDKAQDLGVTNKSMPQVQECFVKFCFLT